jgi:hypothetical protein
VEGGLAQIDTDRPNLRLSLHGDDPPSGVLPTAIITLVGLLGDGPSHYRHYTNNGPVCGQLTPVAGRRGVPKTLLFGTLQTKSFGL